MHGRNHPEHRFVGSVGFDFHRFRLQKSINYLVGRRGVYTFPSLKYQREPRLELIQKSGILDRRGFGQGSNFHMGSRLSVPVAIVVGSEGKGISRLVEETCDLLASLPMAGAVSSLNASVAGGIFLYEAVRQRRGLQSEL